MEKEICRLRSNSVAREIMERSIVLYTITSMCCKLPSLVVPTCKMLNLDDDVDDGCDDDDDCCDDH